MIIKMWRLLLEGLTIIHNIYYLTMNVLGQNNLVMRSVFKFRFNLKSFVSKLLLHFYNLQSKSQKKKICYSSLSFSHNSI